MGDVAHRAVGYTREFLAFAIGDDLNPDGAIALGGRAVVQNVGDRELVKSEFFARHDVLL